MTIHILPFGTLLRCMMFIRNTTTVALAKRAYLPDEAISLVARGMFQPTPELEHKLRVLLEWPKQSDDLLSIVHGSKFADEAAVPEVQPKPAPDPKLAPKPEAVDTAPHLTEQLPVVRKKMGRPRKVRTPELVDLDDDRIMSGDIRGTVLA